MNIGKSIPTLPVPRLMNPITGINCNFGSEGDQPFFGYAPSETPIRLVTCPECNKPVNAAHIHKHQSMHKTLTPNVASQEDNFKIETNSRLLPMAKCNYAERHTWNIGKPITRDPK